MTRNGISAKKSNKKKHVFYETLMGSYGAEYLCCDLLKGAKLGHHLLSLHVFSSSDFKFASGPNKRDEETLEIEKTESPAIQVFEDVNSRDCTGGLKDGNFRLDDGNEEIPLSSISLELPELSLGWPLLHNQIHETNISLDRRADNSTISQQEITKNSTGPGLVQVFEDELVDGNKNQEAENYGLVCEFKEEVSSTSASFQVKELPQLKLGWPLLRIRASMTLDYLRESEAQEMPVVQCVMSLPDRPTIVLGNLELFHRLNLSNYKQFSYEEVTEATSQFSSDNLIGEGGCSNVYKGCLPNGKPVAVKLLKSYKEAWNDFSFEVDIIASLNHKNITSLIGVCTEDNYLILVYDFLPKGSLEEILHGHREKSMLSWKVRFKVAVAIAEALCYLHNESSRPVIHRDVTSSNILLSNDFQPQLSDFGLAIWGPTDSTYIIHTDVVGTFGYIAPEYFMHGRVSDKIDVYSFGVVLLELLSGRRPISSDNGNEQESLVKWAKPLLEGGDLKSLLDPKLDENIDDVVQIHSMVLAANLCINQSSRLRPKMSQILRLLRGEKDANEWVEDSHVNGSDNWEDDDLLSEFVYKPHLDFSFIDTHDDAAALNKVNTTSPGGTKQSRRLKLKEYLKEPLE